MIKRNLIIPVLLIFSLLPVNAQVKKQETGLKREVTLYNPYKPSLPESKKRSFLPDLNDTSKVRPAFHYDVNTTPFLPEYTISPIKAASLLPDPLPKLYKGYINLGIGNYITPLAEISVTNERSKKGSVGFYARHFSSNGKVDLDNGTKVFAGYMDNDVSLFGSKFFRNNILKSSVDFSQKVRYAYGYAPFTTEYFNPFLMDFTPEKSDVRMRYNSLGAKASLASLTMDSASFSYKFDVYYNYFYNEKNLFEHSAGFSGMMAKSYEGLYVGSGISYDYYRLSDSLLTTPKYIASISPFVKKSSEQWSFKLGIEALLDKNMTSAPIFHVYPDFNFSLKIVPSYVSFFAGLSGKLDKNEPSAVISENPYIIRDGSLFKLPNTSHDLVISSGLRGNTGLGGNYMVSASYSLISNMLFYSNIVVPDSVHATSRGSYFSVLTDDVELLNVHAEMSGPITDKLSFNGAANLYKYTLSRFEYAWNKPGWDARIGLKYNLRDKIIAGVEITAQGKRWETVNGNLPVPVTIPDVPINPDQRYIIQMPAHLNLNLSAEYRYSKILSFWTKLNNISNKRYYEWAFYPTQGFLFMFGFTYSL
ncbi:MAG: hypothetical protein ABR927_17620 [Bacteroidales bacterium]|jgi:hypothetical protein